MTSFAKIRNLLAAFAAGVVLLVGYSTESQAAPCPASGTYAQLIALGTCEIGDKTFSGFVFQQVDTSLTAANVVYDIVNSGGQWGFEFGFNLTANNGDPSSDFRLIYDVSCTSGVACITSIHGEINAGAVNGFASLAESWGLGSAFLFTPGGPTSFDRTFAAVSSLHITKDVNVTCDGSPCFITFSGLTNTVDSSRVPEPGTLALLASGLFGLGWVGRRRRR